MVPQSPITNPKSRCLGSGRASAPLAPTSLKHQASSHICSVAHEASSAWNSFPYVCSLNKVLLFKTCSRMTFPTAFPHLHHSSSCTRLSMPGTPDVATGLRDSVAQKINTLRTGTAGLSDTCTPGSKDRTWTQSACGRCSWS